MEKPSVSIVIPNYNGANLLKRNLPLILRTASLYEGNCEVVIVDDGSSDSSRDVIRNFPVRYVFLKENRGFSAACNAGVQASSGDLIFLLNNDVEIYSDVINNLVSFFRKNDTFAAGPLVYRDKSRNSWYGLYIPYFKRGKIRFRLPRVVKESIKNQTTSSKNFFYTGFVIGCSIMFDRKKFLELGGFDEIFSPYYCEDWDLCFRAWKRGWKCYLDLSSWVIHPGGETINKTQKRLWRRAINVRNKLFFNTKHLTETPLFARFILYWLILKPVSAFNKSFYLGFYMYIRNLRTILEKRKREKIQEKVKLTDVLTNIQKQPNLLSNTSYLQYISNHMVVGSISYCK